MDLSTVAEETSDCNPSSVRRDAPVRDRLINLDKQFGDFANLESNVYSVITRPHCSNSYSNIITHSYSRDKCSII